jgi:Flp pilus assembly protein TadD
MLWLGGPLVGTAKIHGNVELAEHAARQLLALDPDSSSWYVLLSYIYATIGMSNKERDIREINEDKV